MEKTQLESLTRIGQSLWGDWTRSYQMSEETLSQLAFMDLDSESALERASKVMIERAEKNPPPRVILNHPFFRLAPIERFLMTALHLEKWSYTKIARTLNIDPKIIPAWAWATRLKYAYDELKLEVDYPRAPSALGPSCPEYNTASPWTQRLLDDELGKQERLFLQNHLMGCPQCRQSLEHTQKLIFKIEATLQSLGTAPDHLNRDFARILASWNVGQKLTDPNQITFLSSFRLFIQQPKMIFVLILLAFIIGIYSLG